MKGITVSENIQSVEIEKSYMSIDELTYFDLPNGMPCFVGDVNEICEHVEANGYNFYYVMGIEKYNYIDNKVSKPATRPSVLKVVSTIISRSVTVADPAELGLDTLETNAEYLLPYIPFELVQMMDDFFRAVEDKHGTESIVLLTYDPEYLDKETPSAGWGILVPDQTNTAADCAYDHESIVSEKDEHVYIVGSAHSHPGMAAFASGTDHKDQADFPGIHITYGWRKNVNNNATEYHIELQTPGAVFSMQPEQVFESRPKSDPSPKIDEWMNKISKKTPAPSTTGIGAGTYSSSNGYSNYSGTTKYGNTGTPKPKTISLPAGFPEVASNIIVAELTSASEEKCPFCSTKFIAPDLNKRRCLSCHQFIAMPGETVDDIVKVRITQGLFSHDIDVSKPIFKDIYIWTRIDNKDTVTLVKAADSMAGGELGKF